MYAIYATDDGFRYHELNYQVDIWRRAHLNNSFIPKPIRGHGWHFVDGNFETLWVDGPILQLTLINLLEPVIKTENDNDDEIG